jgi:hypothetical protein
LLPRQSHWLSKRHVLSRPRAECSSNNLD